MRQARVELRALIDAFAADPAARACADPAGAYANCYALSLRFAAFARARGAACEVLHLRGSRRAFPGAAGRWPHCDPARFEHWVVAVDRLAVDWTARQFVPAAPLPEVIPVAELAACWDEVESWLCVACDPALADPAHAELALGDLHLVHRTVALRTAGAGPFADARHAEGSALPLCAHSSELTAPVNSAMSSGLVT